MLRHSLQLVKPSRLLPGISIGANKPRFGPLISTFTSSNKNYGLVSSCLYNQCPSPTTPSPLSIVGCLSGNVRSFSTSAAPEPPTTESSQPPTPEMASVQVEIENVKRELAATSAALGKIEKDIEECLKKINDIHSNPEAAKKFSLPMLEIILKRLLDNEKSLRDKEKSLIDKEKSLIVTNNILLETKKIDKEKSLIEERKLHLAEKKVGIVRFVDFEDTKLEPFIPYYGSGKLALPRKAKVSFLVDKILKSEVTKNTFYFRGPRGSGKTVLLTEVCRQLVASGCDVYYLPSAGAFTTDANEVISLIENANKRFTATGQLTYVAVDEAQNCKKDNYFWSLILRSPCLAVIITGLSIALDSPSIPDKEPSNFIFFSEEEVKDEVFTAFKNYIASRHPTKTINDAKLLEVLLGIRTYTGGHAFPLMRLCHYVFDEHFDVVMEGYNAVEKLFRPSTFMDLPVMKEIKGRCFNFEEPERKSLRNYLSDPTKFSAEDQLVISKFGFMEGGKILSELFLQFVYANKSIFPEDMYIASNIEDVIVFALSNFTSDLFMEPDRFNYAYENSVGFFFGSKLAKIPGIYLKPQVQVVKEERTAGHLPCLDFYVNGKFDICIEIIKNTSKLESHIDRFEASGGAYKHFQNNYVILDFQMDKKPILSTLPKKYEYLAEKIFTFSYHENCLYKGRVAKFPLVCKNLHVVHESNLGNSMQLYVDKTKKTRK